MMLSTTRRDSSSLMVLMPFHVFRRMTSVPVCVPTHLRYTGIRPLPTFVRATVLVEEDAQTSG